MHRYTYIHLYMINNLAHPLSSNLTPPSCKPTSICVRRALRLRCPKAINARWSTDVTSVPQLYPSGVQLFGSFLRTGTRVRHPVISVKKASLLHSGNPNSLVRLFIIHLKLRCFCHRFLVATHVTLIYRSYLFACTGASHNSHLRR